MANEKEEKDEKPKPDKPKDDGPVAQSDPPAGPPNPDGN